MNTFAASAYLTPSTGNGILDIGEDFGNGSPLSK